MTTSLYVPIAYITILVTSLAIFSRVYRRRRAAEKTSFEPWFPSHTARQQYITLLSADPAPPDSLLKSALLVRATEDVHRILRLRDDKAALGSLHQRGLIGDETMARFAAAEKELEAEVQDVVREAETFRQGWGGFIMGTAVEMAQNEKIREQVMNGMKIREVEMKKLEQRRKYQPDAAKQSLPAPPSAAPSSGTATPQKVSQSDDQVTLAKTPVDATLTPASAQNTPSKGSAKKKGKKK